jgi:hypothetical protein
MSHFITCAFLFSFATSLFAADLPDAKADSLLAGQQKLIEGQSTILAKQTSIYEEVRWDDPFVNRRNGIELNLPGLLIGSRDGIWLAGGYSHFPKNVKMEIAFPFFYHRTTEDDEDLTRFTFDIRPRYFLGKHREGLYIEMGARYLAMSGYESDGDFFGWENPNGERLSVTRLGVFTGVGYRKFSMKGLYWGCSVALGRYYGDEDIKIHGDDSLGGEVLWDVEFFKLGILF